MTLQTNIKNIVDDKTISKTDRIQKLLNLGLEQIDMTMGIVSYIEGNRYAVVYCTNTDLIGEIFQFGNTYCSITMQLEDNRVLGVPHFSVSDYFRHPAYEAFKLESYLGVPIIVNDARYGTLNYTQPLPADEAFSDADYAMMTALSAGIGQLLAELDSN